MNLEARCYLILDSKTSVKKTTLKEETLSQCVGVMRAFEPAFHESLCNLMRMVQANPKDTGIIRNLMFAFGLGRLGSGAFGYVWMPV